MSCRRRGLLLAAEPRHPRVDGCKRDDGRTCTLHLPQHPAAERGATPPKPGEGSATPVQGPGRDLERDSEGVKTPCETCHGKRFKDEVLEYELEGKSISDYLELTVAEALAALESGKGAKKRAPLLRKLEAMRDVGLDYQTLGQPLNTLSGGECQRIKLATELHKRGSVYVLDEPTTGLHMSDIALLMKIIDRLVDKGNTAVGIEHNLDVIRSADWVIDLGPDGGSKGGEIVFEGPPADLLKAKNSLTGAALRCAESSDRRFREQ